MSLIMLILLVFFQSYAAHQQTLPSYADVASGKQKTPQHSFSKKVVPSMLNTQQHALNAYPHQATLQLLEQSRQIIEQLPKKSTPKNQPTILNTVRRLESITEEPISLPIPGCNREWDCQAEAWKRIGQLYQMSNAKDSDRAAMQSFFNALFVAYNNIPDFGCCVNPDVAKSLCQLINRPDGLTNAITIINKVGMPDAHQFLVRFYKYAHQLGSSDGTYLLAKHKQKCNSLKSLKQSERLLSGLTNTQHNAYIDLLVTQHALTTKLEQEHKQAEAEKKKADFLATAEKTLKTRHQFESAVATFEQSDNQDAIYLLAEHMFKKADSTRKDNFRFHAAFEAAKRETDTAKADIYLGIAAHKVPQALTHAFEQHKKATDPKRSMLLLKMAADAGHPQAQYLYALSLKEQYAALKKEYQGKGEKDPAKEAALQTLGLHIEGYLNKASTHKDASFEIKLEYAITASNHEEAIKRLKVLGDDPRVHFYLGEIYKRYAQQPKTKPRMQALYTKKAFEYYQKSANAGHVDAQVDLVHLHLDAAKTTHNRKQRNTHVKNAHKSIDKLLATNTVSVRQKSDLLCKQGNLHLMQENMHECVATLLKAYETDPSNCVASESLYAVTDLLVDRKSHDLLIHTFEKMRQINPSNHENYMGLGVAYLGKNNTKKAIESFEKSENLGSSDAGYNLGLLFAQDTRIEQNLPRAITHLEKALERNPESTKVLNLLGNTYMCKSINRRREARTCFELSAQQGSADGHFSLAQCYQKGVGGALNRYRATFHYTEADTLFKQNKLYEKSASVGKHISLCLYQNRTCLSGYKDEDIPGKFQQIKAKLYDWLKDKSTPPSMHNEIYLALAAQNDFMSSFVKDEQKATEYRLEAQSALSQVIAETKGNTLLIDLSTIRALYSLSSFLLKPIKHCNLQKLTPEQQEHLEIAREALKNITNLERIPERFKDAGILDLALNDLATIYHRFDNDKEKAHATLAKGAERGGTICCIGLAKQYEDKRSLEEAKKVLETGLRYGGMGDETAYKHLIIIKFYLGEKIDIPLEKMFLKDYFKKADPRIKEKENRFAKSKSWKTLDPKQQTTLLRLSHTERKPIFDSISISVQ